jgi:septum formation protein
MPHVLFNNRAPFSKRFCGINSSPLFVGCVFGDTILPNIQRLFRKPTLVRPFPPQIRGFGEGLRVGSRGRPPADPHEILDAIFWKIAHHARWQDLPVDYPSMAVCRRYYRRIFRSGRLCTLYRHLYKDLCTRGRVDLTDLVERGCFKIKGNKVVLRPGLEETWHMRTALLFMQQGYHMLRHLHREKDQERRRRFPSFRRSSRQSSHAPPQRKEEEFSFTPPDAPVHWPKYVLSSHPAPSPAAPMDERLECVRILGVNKPLLVLASNSPRRRELLRLGGWTFHTRPADVDESQHPGEAPAEYVLRLAESKVRACARSAHAGEILLAADTTVVDHQAVLGKPEGAAEAAQMLRNLRGHTHQVLTGLAVLRLNDGTLVTDLCVTDVPMRDYGDDEIEAYVLSGDPLDKAGAYAIQNPAFHPVEGLRGCYASVMGLPLCHLTRSLRKLGTVPGTDIAAECQSALGYACPISTAVLGGEMVG